MMMSLFLGPISGSTSEGPMMHDVESGHDMLLGGIYLSSKWEDTSHDSQTEATAQEPWL